MKRSLPLIFLLSLPLLLSNCSKKNDASINNVIFNLTFDKSTAVADGTTIINVSCQLDTDATADRRNIKFTTSAGTFINSPKDTTSLSQLATFVNHQLIATVKLQVPQTAATITVTAQPDISQQINNNYVLTKTITISPSVPATLVLNSSLPAIGSGYGSESAITGTLTNSAGGKVSLGNTVTFQDFINGTPANGTFRSSVDTTSAASQVSTNYSIGSATSGSKIAIIGSVKNTTIKDTIYLIVK
jgi:hypothetical protein